MNERDTLDEAALSSKRVASLLDAAAARIEALQRARSEPIAIIGIGCRFPGRADGPDGYWRLLRDGVDATGEVPADRWDVDAHFDADPDATGKMYVRRGGFLSAVDGFDARFFEIAPREAMSIDPQQRLALEVAWEALEHAGLSPTALAGTATGVFLGLTTNDYGGLLVREGPAALDAYFSTGNALNASPGRIAHFLGLQGPCLAVDTACSSSLVAVHLACQSLRMGESDVALAGGVNLILAPEVSIAICRARMLAPDGRCKTFDASANGYARAEGCGIVVLKRCSDALAAGHRVLALIRGSAVNQDGASGGFTVPNGRAQEALIRRALASAQVEPAQIDYLEAHGTGTPLGDPIEVHAAAAALGKGRPPNQPLLIGSVKTNIGHAEAAAGIAGLIKVVLALEHGEIPPHLHLHAENPHIPWAELPLAVATERRPWPARETPQLAGVSSFGASGTNAHVVVQAAPAPQAPAAPDAPERPLHLLALSARTPTALRALADRYAAHLGEHPGEPWANVCFSANTGRAQLPVRAVVVAANAEQATVRLRALAATHATAVSDPNAPKIAFLFTGQGSQYVGMGRVLYETQPTFRQRLDRCAEIVNDALARPLLDMLHAPAGSWLDDTAYAQPALFALEYALAELWQSWGVQPAAVMGHSIGEYVAACVARVFGVEDGLRLVVRRARLMAELPAGGAMAAVSAGVEVVAPLVAAHANDVSIAAVNAPQQVVISGGERSVEAILARLASAGIAVQRLRVSRAFHSPLVEPMLAQFERAASEVRYGPPQLPLVSNLTGATANAEFATATYWVRHARATVRFADGIEALVRYGCNVFIEVGPARTLLDLGRQCLHDRPALWLPSLQPSANDWEPLLHSLGRLYERGHPVDWHGFERDYPRERLALPTYPWQRESHWRPSANGRRGGASAAAPMLRNGELDALLRQLGDSGEFSSAELALAPRLLQALARPSRPASGELDDAELRYEIAWRTQPPAARAGAADAWPSPRELAVALQPRLTEAAGDYADAAYLAVLSRLERLSVDYVACAWEQLGWKFVAGTRCHRSGLAERLGVVSRHRRLLERTAAMLAEAGVLHRDGDCWESRTRFTPTAPGPQIAALLAGCPAATAECTLLDRCARRLAEVLTGRQDPLQLLFPDGETTTASGLYRDAPGARMMNRIIREVVERALQQLPAGRQLRILEIGAGTGGTTAGLLEALPADRTDYLFTDISPHFTTAARAQFGRYRFVRYGLLDIERDPAAQGFAAEAVFDLIIAANVLHATRDLAHSLRHVRQLAAPGALLLLLEGTAPIRAVDLIFGLTDGWWRFADEAIRPDYPLISAPDWVALLERNGFRDAVALALPDEPWGALARQALLLARATALGPQTAALPHWVILADAAGIGSRLAVRHAACGGTSTLVSPGPAFERVGERAFRIAGDRPEDFARLVAALDPVQAIEVIHLWSLDEPVLDATGGAAPEPGRLACGSAVSLVQALVDAPPSLAVASTWLITRGAVGGEPQAPLPGLAQAGIWGLCRVVIAEHPELHAACLDLDPDATPDDCAAQLWEELTGGSREAEVRWRGGVRHVARLARHALAEPPVAVRFRGDASYLITGGLGGLGLLTARWMAERGAGTLVLAGRRDPDERAQRACRELEAGGVRVIAQRADVACGGDVEGLFDRIARQLPPLRGIVHAAGVLDDATLRQLDWPRFARVVQPKAAGAWHLHRLTAGLELDFFVLYSSFTAVVGTPGQANHAAANAFLDALAWHRRALGLPALSLDWGAWSDIGAAAQRGVGARLKAHGGASLTPAQGLRLLEQTWDARVAQVAVVPIHWAQVDAQHLRRPLFAELAPAAPPAADASAGVLERVRTASPRRRQALITDYIRAETARVLGLAGAEAIESRQGFFELGMDSLTSVELRNRLHAGLRCKLPTTVAFDYPNAEALAAFVLGLLPSTSLPADEPPAARPWDQVDLAELSVAELDHLIDELADPA